mgnify:CR=1 FL=1
MTTTYDMHQKMQESITVDKSRAAQCPAGDQLIQSLYLDYGEVTGRTELVPDEVTETLASMPTNDDTHTLQAFSGAAKPLGDTVGAKLGDIMGLKLGNIIEEPATSGAPTKRPLVGSIKG